ncbi:TPA: hypothetical protein DEF17_09145 [bacterium]|nr:hypothetical protein [bacterium]
MADAPQKGNASNAGQLYTRYFPRSAENSLKKRNDGNFTIEGFRAVRSVLKSNLKIVTLILIESADGTIQDKFLTLEQDARNRGIEVRHISERHSKNYFDSKNPQGICAVIEQPKDMSLEDFFKTSKRILILDGLNDPGNVGTLVRTASLLAWDGIIILPNTVSPYQPKAARASAGAIGFIKVMRASAKEIQRAAHKNGFTTLRASISKRSKEFEMTEDSKIALILGGEARGTEADWKDSVDVNISMKNLPIDSLGVVASGSILLERYK